MSKDFLSHFDPSNPENVAIYVAAEKLADKHSRELFGRKQNLPLDESEVVFNDSIPHEDKLVY